MLPLRARATLIASCLLTLVACRGRGAEEAEAPEPGAVDGRGEGEAAAAAEDEAAGSLGSAGAQVVSELPPELTGDLREQGADANGRLLTLAPGFIATAACSDCGAPTYLRFMAVRCTDNLHCEVLTETCEGAVSRDEDEVVTISLEPIEGVEDPESCAGYSGSFEAK